MKGKATQWYGGPRKSPAPPLLYSALLSSLFGLSKAPCSRGPRRPRRRRWPFRDPSRRLRDARALHTGSYLRTSACSSLSRAPLSPLVPTTFLGLFSAWVNPIHAGVFLFFEFFFVGTRNAHLQAPLSSGGLVRIDHGAHKKAGRY